MVVVTNVQLLQLIYTLSALLIHVAIYQGGRASTADGCDSKAACSTDRNTFLCVRSAEERRPSCCSVFVKHVVSANKLG
jgi:hypothetical protein